jgi:DNA-binding transcriptional MerR regulator
VRRFWETRFTHIKPLKRGGGRRYYRPDDVELLKGIRQLLYGQGYTIRGVQRILKEGGIRSVQAIGRGERPADLPPPGPAGEGDDALPSVEIGDVEDAPSVAGSPTAGRVAAEDVARLRSALDDLAECERLLDALRPGDEPAPA